MFEHRSERVEVLGPLRENQNVATVPDSGGDVAGGLAGPCPVGDERGGRGTRPWIAVNSPFPAVQRVS